MILFACKEKEVKVVDLNEIMPYSQEEESNNGSVDEIDSNAVLIEHFNSFGIPVDQLDVVDTNLLPSRFGPDNILSYRITSAAETSEYFRWTYPDSVKVMNAFYNWMDCFGVGCSSIFIGEERSFQKGSLMMLVGDSSLIFITGDDIDYNGWYAYHDSLGFDSEWNFSIEQRSGHRARWYTFEGDTKLKYERP